MLHVQIFFFLYPVFFYLPAKDNILEDRAGIILLQQHSGFPEFVYDLWDLLQSTVTSA